MNSKVSDSAKKIFFVYVLSLEELKRPRNQSLYLLTKKVTFKFNKLFVRTIITGHEKKMAKQKLYSEDLYVFQMLQNCLFDLLDFVQGSKSIKINCSYVNTIFT